MSNGSDWFINKINSGEDADRSPITIPDNSPSTDSSSDSSGSFFDGAKKWLGEYIDAVSEGRPMWKSEATIKPVDWGTAGGNGSMPTTFSNSTYENMQNPETTLGDVGNAIADRISEITPDALKPQVIAPNWQPRPLNDSVYSDTPGTPTAGGKFGEIEDENKRQKRMNEDAQWAADNMPRAYSAMLGAVSGAANVAGGIRNALGGENSDWILRNAEKSDEAMKKFRQQWENQYGDSGYLLNPNGLANDIGNGIGSSVPIMALSLLAPEAAVGVGTRAITSALTRAGLGRLAGSKAGQALIEEVVRSPLSTAGDTMAEYGTVVDDLVQGGMSDEEAREKAKGIIPRNIALDTLTLPGELYVMKGAKGLGRKFQAASTDSIGKRIEKGMARAGLMSAANAVPEGYQEGAQNALEDNVKGERNTNWFNPFSWNEDDLKAARGGAVGGAIMGIPGNVAKGMQTYSNTGNVGIDATVDAANEYGLDPKGLLAIGARESGGDDINAIGSNTGSDDPNDHNMFQITDKSASDYGVDKMYPDWKTDPRQNALAAAFILTKKIDENGGDFWAGVAGYNGGGDPDYLATVQNTYNNIPDDYVGGGGSGIQPYNLPTQSAAIDEQVSNLTPEFQSALPTIGGILNEMGLADGAAISSAARTPEHNAEVGGAENSYHVHNDAVDIVLPEGTTQEQADAVAERFRNTGAFKEVLFHDAGSGYHLHLGGYNGGLNSRGGAGGTAESTYKGDGGAAYMEEQREADRQYQQEQRDRDNAYQQEINNIMNDNTSETIANDVDKEMKEAKAQQEESMKALTPEQQKEEISDYLDSVSQDDISDEDFNALWDATQSNDPKQIQTAYQTVQDAKKSQTAKPIKTEDTPVLKSVQKQKQPAQQGATNTENTSANQTGPNTQPVQDNKQTQPLEQTVQPPLNTAPNSNPIHAQQGAMNNETTQSTQSTNNQNVNTKPEQNQRENAETVQAQKGTENQGTTGIIENVRTDNAKQNIPAQYKLVSADDVISSDMPAYPQQYQPRNRNRLGMVAQVEDMANQLNPSAVVDQTGSVNMGAPVINSKGVVLNGNGRTMAIRKAYSKGNKSAQAYKQYLKNNAEKLGLDPNAVDRIKNPMIVRQVADDAPIEDIIHSTAGGSRMSASEQAKSDAKKIRTSTLDKYKKENPPDLSAPSNRAFVKSILDDITTDADRNAMYTESGQITKEAIRRVQDALFARAYGDDSLLNRMTESTDDNIRIVSKVMLQCAPKVAKLKEGQEHGDFYSEYDVSNVITQAAKDLIEARDAGKPISYKLRENDMFETSKRKDDEAIKITLKFFDDNKRKPRRIQEYVNSLADYVIGMGNPKFETESSPLFDGGDRMTMDELANFTEEEINGGRNSNLHVEGERTDTETKSVPQTVQEESGTAGNGSVQESNGTEGVTQNTKTEVKENVALQPVKNAMAKGSYKLIAKEAIEYANNVVSGLKDGTLTKEQAQLRVNDLVSALQTKESNGNSVMGNIPKFMKKTILDALKMTKDAINGNIEYAGMSKKETQAAKMLDETIKGIKDGSITPAKADDELRNARVAAKENGKQSYAFSKKLKEAEDFIKDKNNYGTEPEEKQEEPVQERISNAEEAMKRINKILQELDAGKMTKKEAQQRILDIDKAIIQLVSNEKDLDIRENLGIAYNKCRVTEQILGIKNKYHVVNPTQSNKLVRYDTTSEANVNKPQGLYMSYAESGAPHWEAGTKIIEKMSNPDARILDVDARAKYKSYRSKNRPIECGAGVDAAAKLIGKDKVQKFLLTPLKDLKKKAKEMYPNANFDTYYDTNEVVEAIGGLEARKQGYDAIRMLDTEMPEMSEYVALTENAFSGAKENSNTTEPKEEIKQERTSPDEIDLRTISIEDAERQAMEALGIKPHKKPVLPKPTKGTPKPRKRTPIKDDETIDFHIHIVDDSDEALARALKVFNEEASKLNANPMFNPRLMTAAMEIGAIHAQRGANKFIDWLKAMSSTDSRLKSYAPAVWKALQVFPKNGTLNEKQMTSLIQFVGVMYHHGITDKTDLRKRFVAALGVKNARYFDTAYTAIVEYPTADELKGIDTKEEPEQNTKEEQANTATKQSVKNISDMEKEMDDILDNDKITHDDILQIYRLTNRIGKESVSIMDKLDDIFENDIKSYEKYEKKTDYEARDLEKRAEEDSQKYITNMQDKLVKQLLSAYKKQYRENYKNHRNEIFDDWAREQKPYISELPNEIKKNRKTFIALLQQAEKGANANVNDSTSGMAARASEGNNQNTVGANDESRRPGSGNGQNISQAGKGQEKHNVGNTGIHAGSTSTSGKTSNSRVQKEKSDDSTSSTGSADLSGSVRDSLAGVPSDEQKRPDELSTSVKNGRIDESNNKQVTNAHDSKHIESIRKEVPILKPEQAGDVAFAERRLIDNNKNGVLFTNGTGTGKTFSGLGIIKRMYDKGKKNIIVVAPNTNIIKQWVDAAKEHFGIEMIPLENVKDSGKEVCITTFANFGYNHELAKKDWDLVVCDESQNLMSGANANPTNALRTLRAITHHEEGFTRWLKDNHSELWDELQKASEIDEKEKTEESKKKYDEAYKKWNNAELEAKKDYPGLKKSKVVFLSATPFAYVPNIDYANGYLFDYGGDKNTGGYNQPNGKQQFFINHFGYKMRYNRLEKPDAEVDSGIMEREFHNWLAKQGALSGRQLVIDKDYDRGFIRIDGGIGKIIDEGREYVLKKYPAVAYITQAETKANPIFDKYMLEAIKAKAAVELAKEYIKQGKKVVVFHDFKVGGAYHPFKKDESKLSGDFLEEYRRFAADWPDLVNLDLSDLKTPIVRFKEAFGNDGTLAIFNGDISKKNREKAQKDFNDDNGKTKVILVQSDAGQAGISLHDTTGKYQRVLINLGMPTKPTASIQIEGRIYRTGNKSNAIIRYLNTGTNIEQNAFATRIAERASTAENLALGDKARALKKAFIDGFEESQDSDEWEKYLPGSPTEGTGGKEKDRENDDAEHGEWDKAKAKYFANQKKTGSNKSAEGVDYYATPEPLGLKMVEWSQPKANQSMLEPSAGHGAIAQWFPSNTKNTVVEPSNNLVPKLQMHVDNANVVNNYFENIGTWNKFDRIVMNPPFGKGGKTAIEHLAKAYKHLREGGRIVSLIPDGLACQKRFDKWFWEDGKGTNRNGKEVTTEAPSKTGAIREEIALPSVTFERAGTKVATKIVIIDKFPSKEAAKNYNDMTVNVDMRNYSSIKEFFNALENKTVPDVLTDTENNEKQKNEKKEVIATLVETQTKESTSAKTETPKEQKTGKLTDDEIAALENKGFNRWTKGDMDRLYIKPTYLGLDLEYYKSGNISSATFNGDSISNSEGRRLNATKCYVDVATRKVVCDNEELKQAAQELLDTTLDTTKYSVRDNSKEIRRSIQEVKDEIKDALPTAKDVTEDGNTITFTMPNGSKIAVDVQNQIALTEEQLSQAKKDHNINGNVVVEGYAQKYGKDAYIALSQGSRKGTGYHEVYHVAEDTVLNDKEKAALRKKYPNEEVRADKYAEWVEARKHGKGTLFGKLFRKIQDFAKKMQAILTRTENVHNVFRKIESGEVWNRKASETNKKGKASLREEKTPLNPKEREQEQRKEDILKAINEIVPVYTKSDVKKNAVTETYYDRRQKAGFVKTPTIREYGRILALNLDQQLKLKNNMELTTNVKQELEKNQAYAALMGDKIKGMTPIQARAEGVSIFGSLYFNGNEEAAAARFPKYYEAFKNALKENKELNDKVNHITEMIGDYKAQNPVLRANSGMQMHDKRKKTTKDKVSDILNSLYTDFADEQHPLTMITKMAKHQTGKAIMYKYDVHKQALMAKGNAQAKANLLLNSGKNKEFAIKALNEMFHGAIQYKVNMNDITDAIKNVPQEELKKIGVDDARQGLAKYLIAMRTEELSNVLNNEYVRPDGFDEEACHTIIKDAPESIKTAAKMVWDFNKNMINIMQQQGLINKKAADTMRKYTYYVPMYHDMSDMQDIDDFIGVVGKGGRGFVDIKPNIYEIKGGNERAIIDPIESMVRMTVTLLDKCQRNNVGKTLARLNQDFEGMGNIIVKDPTLKHEDPKKCAFSVYVGGKKVIYRTTPEVYNTLTQVDENTTNMIASICRSMAKMKRVGATITPSFICRNLIRDSIFAGITSKTGFIPFVDTFRGMRKLITDKEFKAQYLASGASMGTFIRSDIEGSKDLLKEITGDKYSSWPKGLKQIAQLTNAVWDFYKQIGNVIEDSNRAGEFMRARKKGIGLEEAGYLAKEVTLNFGRHGRIGKKWNRYIPFFNATIQGTDKLVRAFIDNPARTSFMIAVTIILPSIVVWALANSGDDDWYQDLDANTKYTNWCIGIGDTHILIPKPQETGILFGSGVEAVLNQMMGNDPQAMKQWAKQYLSTILPGILPATLESWIEWIADYSFWKGRKLVPKSLSGEPSEYQYNSYTSEIAKALGNTEIAKSVKMSPIAIDNFISGYFASSGRFIANMLNSPVAYLRGSRRPPEPAKYWYEMPFVGSFVRRNHEISEYQNRFYDLASDMTDDYNRMKHDNPKAKPPKGYKEMETAKKTVSKLNKEISEIKSDPKMGPEQKLQQIELRQNKIRHFTKKFVTQYGK